MEWDSELGSPPGSVLRTAVPGRGLGNTSYPVPARGHRVSSWDPHFSTSAMGEVWITMGLVKVNETV